MSLALADYDIDFCYSKSCDMSPILPEDIRDLSHGIRKQTTYSSR